MVQELSTTLPIGPHSYHIHRSPNATLQPYLAKRLHGFDIDYIPTARIDWTEQTFKKHDLESVCRNYEENDDVWTRDFLPRMSNHPRTS
jgi:hypothetical protein